MARLSENRSDSTIDSRDVARFDRLGQDWWNPHGAMRALHKFNPVRVAYLRDLLSRRMPKPEGGRQPSTPLEGLEILDIGCGGGILSEPLAAMGARMTSIDPAPNNIEVARRHAEKTGLSIEYICTTAESLAAEGRNFDAVLTMEVIEHVRDPKVFLRSASSMLRPGGILVAATLNRTLKSFALAIVGAEYVLNWVPKGTHNWERFVTPAELAAALRANHLHIVDETGVVYQALTDRWCLGRNMDVNYIMAAERRG
jgi:2-polyprenyl-6-hydroxyphenyl methylase/3-demethylubiquinone-9 3-methyltransferase